jgi:hypothetical protein
MIQKSKSNKPSCGLCGNIVNLIKTECCDNWICDDSHKYMMFSYTRNSCFRNHSQFTVCSYHYYEGHSGKWQDCKICRESFETEDYVDMATNKYNFEKLKKTPKYKPTLCSKCGRIIILKNGGFALTSEGYICGKCFH